jgi:hypothetical protein
MKGTFSRLIPGPDPVPGHGLGAVGQAGPRRPKHLQQLLHLAHRLLEDVVAERQVQQRQVARLHQPQPADRRRQRPIGDARRRPRRRSGRRHLAAGRTTAPRQGTDGRLDLGGDSGRAERPLRARSGVDVGDAVRRRRRRGTPGTRGLRPGTDGARTEGNRGSGTGPGNGLTR